MSGANAISGISIIGALYGSNVAYDAQHTLVSGILAFVASCSCNDQRRWWICSNESYAEYDCWKETQRCLRWKIGFQLDIYCLPHCSFLD